MSGLTLEPRILNNFMEWDSDMPGFTWQLAKPKPPPKPKAADDVRDAVDLLAAPVVAEMKKARCITPKNPEFNWPDDFFTRWNRSSLYFVVVMRTPHGQPPTFEVHAARMEYAGDGKFNLAVPMRRGWNTFKRNATPEACLKEISKSVYF